MYHDLQNKIIPKFKKLFNKNRNIIIDIIQELTSTECLVLDSLLKNFPIKRIPITLILSQEEFEIMLQNITERLSKSIIKETKFWQPVEKSITYKIINRVAQELRSKLSYFLKGV